MSISEHKHMSKADAPARRIEIFTGAGRRRAWSAEEKAAIVAELRWPGARSSFWPKHGGRGNLRRSAAKLSC